MPNGFDLALSAFGLTLFAVSVAILWKARMREHELVPRLEALALAMSRIEAALHAESARRREDSLKATRADDEEFRRSMDAFQDSTLTMLSTMADLQRDQLDRFAAHLTGTADATVRKPDEVRRLLPAGPQVAQDLTAASRLRAQGNNAEA